MPVAKTWDEGTQQWVPTVIGVQGPPGPDGVDGVDGESANASGGGNDKVFWENDNTVTTSYTITTGDNAMTAGPIEIQDGATVTIPVGSTWTIV